MGVGDSDLAFKNAIFSGGGSRCFWQLGFWDGANDGGLGLNETVDYAAGTSAGCALATAAFLNRGPEALELFKALTDANHANIHWRNLRPGRSSAVLPHLAMYREALQRFLSEQDLEAMAHKRIEFLIGRFPAMLRGVLGNVTALLIYLLERHLFEPVHPNWARKVGFEPLVRGNHDAENIDDFISMILAASRVPAVLPVDGYRGEPVIDGGVIDNVPAFLADGNSGRTLVFLSKRFDKPLPQVANRVYVQPSAPVPIDKFDYANPDGLQAAYDLGHRDGRRFAGAC